MITSEKCNSTKARKERQKSRMGWNGVGVSSYKFPKLRPRQFVKLGI